MIFVQYPEHLKKATPSTIPYYTDIDECARLTHDCGDNSVCINTDGGFDCVCRPGFDRINGTGVCRGVQAYQDF